MNIADIRRQNLRILMEQHTATKLATMLGYRQSSFLSQMAGPHPTREVTEKTVRAFEKQLDLPVGTFDTPMGEVTAPPPPSATDMLSMVLNATRTVGRVCETEAVNLPTSKFAEIVALILEDTMGHGGTVREDHVKRVVSLLK